MKLPSALQLFLTIAIPISLAVWGNRECTSKTQYRQQRDSAYLVIDTLRADLQVSRDSTSKLAVLWRDCKLQAAAAKEFASSLAERLNEAVSTVGHQIDGMNQQQQRLAVLKGLVANKSLSARRLADSTALRDTTRPLQADAELVASVAKTTYWLKIYQDSTANMLKAYSTKYVENQAKDDTIREQKEALLDAEGVFVTEAGTKRPFGIGRKKAMRKGGAAVRRIRTGLKHL